MDSITKTDLNKALPKLLVEDLELEKYAGSKSEATRSLMEMVGQHTWLNLPTNRFPTKNS